MKTELGLEDASIVGFLTEEPTRVKPYELDERWSREMARGDRRPIVAGLGHRAIGTKVEERLKLRFPTADR